MFSPCSYVRLHRGVLNNAPLKRWATSGKAKRGEDHEWHGGEQWEDHAHCAQCKGQEPNQKINRAHVSVLNGDVGGSPNIGTLVQRCVNKITSATLETVSCSSQQTKGLLPTAGQRSLCAILAELEIDFGMQFLPLTRHDALAWTGRVVQEDRAAGRQEME